MPTNPDFRDANGRGELTPESENARREAALYYSDSEEEEAKSAENFGEHYGAHVQRLKCKERWWLGVAVVLIGAVFSISVWYPYLGCTDKSPCFSATEEHRLLIYYGGKFMMIILLMSLLVWSARMYNHVRRLKIVYKDKEIIGKTFAKFIRAGEEESTEFARKYAIKHLFSPTLDAIEKDKNQNLEIDSMISLLDSCKHFSHP